MRLKLIHLAFCAMPLTAISQQNYITKDPIQDYQLAKQWFYEGNYSLAYPVFKDFGQKLSREVPTNNQLQREEVRFFSIACELMQMKNNAATSALDFLDDHTSESLKGQMAYYLGTYYFKNNQVNESLAAFEKSYAENLTEAQLSTMQFAKGYGYFTQKKFNLAKPLLAAAKANQESEYYVDANYYYGLILFNERRYAEAKKSFEIAKQSEKYAGLIPYYNASITYTLGNKDEAIKLAEDAINSGGKQYYSTELKQLIGHGYFEKKEYSKALPYLEQYVKESDKVKREDLYELGYSYYVSNQLEKAIDQFKPLSGGQDTLSQDAMYLLGDSYLKTNQKANARNAFLFCSNNSSNVQKKEISTFNYGKLSYELGFDNEASYTLKDFISKYPNSKYNAEAKDLLINVLSNTSNYKEALDLYESLPNKSEASQSQYAKILYNRAQELLNDKKISQANVLLLKAYKAPNNGAVLPLVNFWLGEIAYNNGSYPSAIGYYKDYLAKPLTSGDVNPDNARYNLAYSYLRNEDYANAQKEFATLQSKSLASKQLNEDVTIRLADSYYMQKSFTNAASLYNKVISSNGIAGDYATFQTAMIDGALNKKTSKIEKLQSIDRNYTNSLLIPASLMEIANVYLDDENYSNAVPYLNRIINNKSSSNLKPEALLKLGLAQYNLKKNDEALTTFKSLVKQYPQTEESEDALDNIKSIYIEKGKAADYIAYSNSIGRNIDNQAADSLTYSAIELQLLDNKTTEAIESLKDYITRYPNGRYIIDAHYNIANLYNDKKDAANALTHYEYVAGNAPNKYAEAAILATARNYYFDKKDYTKATQYFTQLKAYASNDENLLEAMRGLVRCQYYNKQYTEAVNNAKDLLNQRGAGTDDKVFANLTLGKSAQENKNYTEAITYYKQVTTLNKAEYGAEARYAIATCQFLTNKLDDAEKTAFEVIQKSASYEFWVAKSYLLLGDIYLKQKDYFNAKATFQSVASASTITEIVTEAKQKLAQVEAAEQAASKIN